MVTSGLLAGRLPMFVLGQKQTSDQVRVTSALPPKADIVSQPWNVRFVPIPDKVHCSNRT
jgi:hypothetical protein